MNTAVLRLDIAGIPQDWVTPEQVAKIFCEGDIVWQTGPIVATLRGGRSRLTGKQTVFPVPAVIATRGRATVDMASFVPPLTRHNERLFARDRHLCAYCGDRFHGRHLSRDHVVPLSRHGRDEWTNVVSACVPCNTRKAARSPEQAGMPLLYLPYAPNWFEDFLLQRGGRTILADQMEFLAGRLPPHSRLL